MVELFQAVRENVSALAAADRYGVEHNRQGMARCIFHNERTASMKIYDGTAHDRHSGFYCYGCHKSGTVIDLAAQLLGVTILEAAQTIAADFGVPYDDQRHYRPDPAAKEAARRRKIQQYLDEKIEEARNIVLDLCRELPRWMETLDPMSEEFCRAVFDRDRVEYLADLFLYGSYEDQVEAVIIGKKELKSYEGELRNIARRTQNAGRRTDEK